jgi:hypothetical protein
MKKFTILFLATLFMVAGTAYLISMSGADKAERQAFNENILAMKKAMLGSTGLEVTPPDRVARTRGEGRARTINGTVEKKFDEDEDGDVSACPSLCGVTELTTTLGPGDARDYCLQCCEMQVVKLDVYSERLGAPTDVALVVTDDMGATIAVDDDGRGLGGSSTDSCLIFACPADGMYNVNVSNGAAIGTADQAVVTIASTIVCDYEMEPNDPGTPGSLNACDTGGVVDEFGDVSADEDADGGVGGEFAGTIGGAGADIDCWNVCLVPGEVLFVAIDSGECDDTNDGLQGDPIITLEDANGAVVATDDDTSDVDPGLVFRAPDMGNEFDAYTVCLAEASPLSNASTYHLVWSIGAATDVGDINCAGGGGADEDSDDL